MSEEFIAYITKYALTQGIYAVAAEENRTSGIRVRNENGYIEHYYGNDWHSRMEEAIARAEEMRAAKLKSIDKQRKRIEGLKFT